MSGGCTFNFYVGLVGRGGALSVRCSNECAGARIDE